MKLAGTIVLLVTLAACGRQDRSALVSEAYGDLGRSDYQGAIAKFESALMAMAIDDPDFVATKLGEIEAWIYVDGTRAERELVSLTGSHPTGVELADYLRIAWQLATADEFDVATRLIGLATDRFGKSERLETMAESIGKRAEEASSPEALQSVEALKSLGYLSQ